MSDEQPTKKQKVADFVLQADLVASAEAFSKSGQVISYAEANKLWAMALDGPGVTNNEFKTLEHILETFKFTDKARAYLLALAINTPSGTSGYKTIDKVRYDRSCLDLADHLFKDGTIDVADAKQLWADVEDGHRVTTTEQRTIKYIIDNYKLTEGAKQFLADQLQSDRFVILNTGAKMPIVGFGTFLAKPGEVSTAIECALKAGYRHIDCAACYENEKEIGEVFNRVFNEEKSVKREDVFITSKLWVTNFHPKDVRAGLEQTLKDLQLTYLDLYITHIPVPCEKKDGSKPVALRRAGYSLNDTWKKMEEAHKDGLCKAIGVSNYPAVMLNDLQNCCEIMPAVNQIERHPYLAQDANLAFNKKLGVSITAYAPLGAPGLMNEGLKVTPLLENEVIKAIADRHGKTPGQVLIRWSIDTGCVVIPKSVTPSRIESNFDVFDFKLSKADLKTIATLDRPGNSGRTFAQDWMGIPCFA